jgi:hypothetical protein
LAVVAYESGIFIFPNATGSPGQIEAPIDGYKCAYDNQGNLFVDSIDRFQIVELPKGASQFENVTLDKTGEWPAGDIHWDGQYMAISTAVNRRRLIYQFSVSGSTGTVVRTIRFYRQEKSAQFWIQGNTIIGQMPHESHIGFWPYPDGGQPSTILNSIAGDVTISVAPSGPRIHK